MMYMTDIREGSMSGIVSTIRVSSGKKKDPRVRNESHLLYVLMRMMQGAPGPFGPMDLVKKLMWKDGHMVADTQHYIRDREGRFAIFDDQYSVRDSAKDFNAGKTVDFAMMMTQRTALAKGPRRRNTGWVPNSGR